MSTSETRSDAPEVRIPAPRRSEWGESWTDRLGWEETPDPERVSRA
ncbi:hypothetical protein [Pseudonocardia alni]|jgi:hypothetical protein|uniref:Uncharacterized protein n=1 Tax=Pseudonocardia alni TaxID=33907 RepID=A0AA44URB2_PSEA5|nr:hypothetical protein [Pseudonocardia alni]PKB31921.1 hypothetical protein ATL51_3624 [Pseudonocardia alni]